MANHAGYLILAPVIFPPEPTNPDIGQLLEPNASLVYLSTPHFGAGADTDTQPVDEPAESHTGNVLKLFGFLDWYERIHVYPLRIDLGNIVSIQVRTIVTWNAFFTPVTLAQVIPANDEGLTLTPPAPVPLEYRPLEQFDFQLTITTEGPGVVGATYTFDYGSAQYTVEVVGVRIVGWSWEANWINPVIERFEYRTDVLEAYNASEQRRSLREFPREQWEFTFDVQDSQRRLFENIIYAWGARVWALPIWVDVDLLTAQLTAGALVIPVTTLEGRDFRVGGIGMLIGDAGAYESFEITSIDASPPALHIGTPLLSTWPIGTRLYPARTARLRDPRATSRYHRNYARGLALFRTVEEIEGELLTETLYRNRPVMTQEPNWRDAPDIDYQRKLGEMDFGYGADRVVDEAELALPVHSFRWTMLSREDVEYFRQWIRARAGRCKGIWLPTWSDDLVLAAPVAATALNIDMEAAGLTYFALGDVHRRDIRVQMRDGTIYYRRVTGFVVVDAVTERMTMDQPFGVLIQPGNVERISWMHYVRLDTDIIELAWSTPAHAEATLILKGPRNEF